MPTREEIYNWIFHPIRTAAYSESGQSTRDSYYRSQFESGGMQIATAQLLYQSGVENATPEIRAAFIKANAPAIREQAEKNAAEFKYRVGGEKESSRKGMGAYYATKKVGTLPTLAFSTAHELQEQLRDAQEGKTGYGAHTTEGSLTDIANNFLGSRAASAGLSPDEADAFLMTRGALKGKETQAEGVSTPFSLLDVTLGRKEKIAAARAAVAKEAKEKRDREVTAGIIKALFEGPKKRTATGRIGGAF